MSSVPKQRGFGRAARTHIRPFSATSVFSESGRLFITPGDTDYGQRVGHGDVCLFGSATKSTLRRVPSLQWQGGPR